MSYQVLARKWRPRAFSTLVGQEHVQKALTNALASGRIHHAYLFTGTRGVGKTTISRILAKSLNCEQGVSATPCCECPVCLDIDAGRFVDLIEVDAASRTKVEDTREILDNVQYRPSRGRYKVYLIDEVHMLSNSSFNALLKTLEEPPEHVVFFLATTDPQKIPATVLSRCLQFHLKSLEVEQIAEQLETILKAESIPAEKPALIKLAQAADGSMRDGLSLLDQAIAYSNAHIELAAVNAMLGTVDARQVEALLSALVDDDAKQLLSVLQGIRNSAPDYSHILEDFIQLLHQIALYQVTEYLAEYDNRSEAIKQFGQQIPREDVQLFYQLALHGRRDLPLAPSLYQGLEMTFLRLLAFRPRPNGVAIEAIGVKGQATLSGKVSEEAPKQRPASGHLERKKNNESAVASQMAEPSRSQQPEQETAENAIAALKAQLRPTTQLQPTTADKPSPQERQASLEAKPDPVSPVLSGNKVKQTEPDSSELKQERPQPETNSKKRETSTARETFDVVADFFGEDDLLLAETLTTGSAIASKPTAKSAVLAQEKPLADKEPLADEKPLVEEEPSADKMPSAGKTPSAEIKPTAESKPFFEETPMAENGVPKEKAATESSAPEAQTTSRLFDEQAIVDKPIAAPEETEAFIDNKSDAPYGEAPPALNEANSNREQKKHVYLLSDINNDVWSQLVSEIEFTGLLAQIVRNSTVKSHDDQHLVLQVTSDCYHYGNAERIAKIKEALDPRIQENQWRLSVENAGGDLTDTPLIRQEKAQQEKQAAVLAELEADKNLQMLRMHFNLELKADNITLK